MLTAQNGLGVREWGSIPSWLPSPTAQANSNLSGADGQAPSHTSGLDEWLFMGGADVVPRGQMSCSDSSLPPAPLQLLTLN